MKNILSHYQFNLTYEQLNTFNEFFSHESHKINKVVSFDMLSDVLMYLGTKPKKETQFNNELFSKIIVEATNDFIVGHKMPLSKN